MLTVGVDVGGSSVRAGAVSATGEVLDIERAPAPGSEQSLQHTVAEVVRRLCRRHPVAGVGLAVAGFVDTAHQRVLFSPHLPWRSAPVARQIGQELGLPVVLEHDVNAAALAEHRLGAARGRGVTVVVGIGTGIGGALLVDGTLFRGAHGVAPELGHLRVVPDGRPCPCGKRGCWERYCSGTALAVTAVELLAEYPGLASALATQVAADPGALTGRQVAAAAQDGDPIGRRAVAELARWLGEGLALVADVYDPATVVLVGGVAGSALLFLDEARQHYARAVTGAGHRPLARIRTSELGEDAPVVGAALLAHDLL